VSLAWIYPLQDLTETPLPDGSPILRHAVPILIPAKDSVHFGVLDSGSPLSVTSRRFARQAGIDLDAAVPVMEVPLGLAARFDRLPVFEINLELQAPDGSDTVSWNLRVAVRPTWNFPFEVLFGQRGWFDSFTTTFGPGHLAVEPEAAFGDRFRTSA